jgi:hypothetical protein
MEESENTRNATEEGAILIALLPDIKIDGLQ